MERTIQIDWLSDESFRFRRVSWNFTARLEQSRTVVSRASKMASSSEEAIDEPLDIDHGELP